MVKFVISFCLAAFCLILGACNPDEETFGVRDGDSSKSENVDTLRMFIEENNGMSVKYRLGDASFSMVKVNGGSFDMGAQSKDSMSVNYDVNADSISESFVHKVSLSGYYIGATEVTRALWHAVMEMDKDSVSGADVPVTDVSYADVNTFLERLNSAVVYSDSTMQKRIDSPIFVLPTEAQWEFAARGGSLSNGFLYAGSNVLADVAWYSENASSVQPVATKMANELGLYDMSGNVMEWCRDRYDSLSYSAEEQTNPVFMKGSFPIARSGSFMSLGKDCRNSSRKYFVSSYFSYIGFRLVY